MINSQINWKNERLHGVRIRWRIQDSSFFSYVSRCQLTRSRFQYKYVLPTWINYPPPILSNLSATEGWNQPRLSLCNVYADRHAQAGKSWHLSIQANQSSRLTVPCSSGSLCRSARLEAVSGQGILKTSPQLYTVVQLNIVQTISGDNKNCPLCPKTMMWKSTSEFIHKILQFCTLSKFRAK